MAKPDIAQEVFDVLNSHSLTSKQAAPICIAALKMMITDEVEAEAAACEAAEAARGRDAKQLTPAEYRRKHGCIAAPPQAKATAGGK